MVMAERLTLNYISLQVCTDVCISSSYLPPASPSSSPSCFLPSPITPSLHPSPLNFSLSLSLSLTHSPPSSPPSLPSIQVMKHAFEQKSPKVQSESLEWLGQAIKEFGFLWVRHKIPPCSLIPQTPTHVYQCGLKHLYAFISQPGCIMCSCSMYTCRYMYTRLHPFSYTPKMQVYSFDLWPQAIVSIQLGR